MISGRAPQTQQPRVINAERQQLAGPVVGNTRTCFLCFRGFVILDSLSRFCLPDLRWLPADVGGVDRATIGTGTGN
jgi:hypothetical protein